MTALSRREFGKVVIAGVPLAAALNSVRLGAESRVIVGVSASSFRDLPRATGFDNVDDVVRALQTVGARHIEFALANVEPGPPSVAPFIGGSPAYPVRVVLTPEQIASTNAYYRGTLRSWRAQTAPSVFEGVGRKLTAAGMTVRACATAFDASHTDEEIDATFRQVKAIGATTVTSPLTMAMAARLAPFATRHQMTIAIHNDVDGNAAGAIATGQLEKALALSPVFKLALDIGNLTASNCDAVEELRRYQPRVSHVLVKDRLRGGGASQPFGEGDTPIAGVLSVLASSTTPIPALVEYDYIGLRSAEAEVRSALKYVEQAAGKR